MSRIQRERELFNHCLEHPPQEWEALLDASCGDDRELREQVLRLLRKHRQSSTDAGGFLKLHADDPKVIGPYRILQRLGEGGMGLVYSAEQRTPVQRRVAIKVLRSGYNSREVLARFDAERQALSLMTHPGIARILDAGTTSDHRPYIVMEHVPGEAITDYCARHRSPLAERLRLMQEACDAVHHAHQRGIIHRDLKPSNILVTEVDRRPVVKVIDFGIAKALSQHLTEHTLETKVGTLLGTPDFMSPEQAEGSVLDIDTRSDVYALGAVLYQLLTDVTPLQLAGSGKSYSEILEAIREHSPLPPSKRVGAGRRRIPRELDWITCKALARQRSDRYESAAALGNDIRNHLTNGLISAGPPSHFRLLVKLLQRHWFAGAALLAIIATMAISQLVLLQKNRELEAQRDRATQEARTAQQVTRFTSELFSLANPAVAGARDVTARELLDTGTRQLERELEDESDEVVAALLESAGQAYRGLGAFDESIRLLDKALVLRKRSATEQPAALAETLLQAALTQLEQGDAVAAESTAREAVAIYATLPDERESGLVRARAHVGYFLFRQRRYEEASGILEQALRESTTQSEASMYAASVLGRVRRAQGRFEESERLLTQVVRTEQKIGEFRTQLARDSMLILAGMYADRGDHELAIRLLRELRSEVSELFGSEHPETAVVLNNLGRSLMMSEPHRAEAETVLREALQAFTIKHGDDHPTALIFRKNLVDLYRRKGDTEQAIRMGRDLVERANRVLGREHIDTALFKSHLAFALQDRGSLEEAEALFQEVERIYARELGEQHWWTGMLRHRFGLLLVKQQRWVESLEKLESAERIFRDVYGERHERTRDVRQAIDRVRGSMR